MIKQHRIHELAKDMGLPSKDLMEIMEGKADLTKKHMSALDDEQLSYLFEKLTERNQLPNLDSYLEKKPVAKEAPKARPQKAAKPKKPKEKLQTVKLPVVQDPEAEKAAEEIAKQAKTLRHVDTRTVDVNLDKFNEKYDRIAPQTPKTKNAVTKQKFTSRGPVSYTHLDVYKRQCSRCCPPT